MHEVAVTQLEIAQIYEAEAKSAENLERTAKWIDTAMAVYNVGSSAAAVKGAKAQGATQQAQATQTVQQRWQAAGRDATTPIGQAQQKAEIAIEAARLDAEAAQAIEEQPVMARDEQEGKIGAKTIVEKAIDTSLSFTREQYRADDEADQMSAQSTRKLADSSFEVVGSDREMVDDDRELTTEMLKLQSVLRKKG